MQIFGMYDLMAAYAHSQEGGQALHLHTLTMGHPLFKRYGEIAHLLDMDKTRLIATAKRLGVRIIKVEHEGTVKQHIDLCGKPLERAKLQAEREQFSIQPTPLNRRRPWPAAVLAALAEPGSRNYLCQKSPHLKQRIRFYMQCSEGYCVTTTLFVA